MKDKIKNSLHPITIPEENKLLWWLKRNKARLVNIITSNNSSENSSSETGDSENSELNVLTIYGELHPDGPDFEFSLNGIEGTEQQINDIINKPFIVRFIIVLFDDSNNPTAVTVVSGEYAISFNVGSDYGDIVVYFILDPEAPTVTCIYHNIVVSIVDNKLRLTDDDLYSTEQTEITSPLDNTLVTITSQVRGK